MKGGHHDLVVSQHGAGMHRACLFLNGASPEGLAPLRTWAGAGFQPAPALNPIPKI